MDSTVIQEIANQLGMSVDQAGQFVESNLPAFAGMQSMYATFYSAIAIVLFCACVIALAVSLKTISKESKKSHPETDYFKLYASVAVVIVSGIVIFIAAIAMIVNIPNAIGWANYPEAMLMGMAIQAIG